ncbi:MAG: SemiSWEET family transporter [Patescibacteria group bacterium]|nr:SemiSWEET family transporter [Patescibacteria group bacterium]
MLSSFIGVLWSVVSLAVTFCGFPHEIIKNWRGKKVGMSPVLIVAALASYLCGSLYGSSKPDWFIMVMQVPACLLAAVILGQWILYRQKSTTRVPR